MLAERREGDRTRREKPPNRAEHNRVESPVAAWTHPPFKDDMEGPARGGREHRVLFVLLLVVSVREGGCSCELVRAAAPRARALPKVNGRVPEPPSSPSTNISRPPVFPSRTHTLARPRHPHDGLDPAAFAVVPTGLPPAAAAGLPPATTASSRRRRAVSPPVPVRPRLALGVLLARARLAPRPPPARPRHPSRRRWLPRAGTRSLGSRGGGSGSGGRPLARARGRRVRAGRQQLVAPAVLTSADDGGRAVNPACSRWGQAAPAELAQLWRPERAGRRRAVCAPARQVARQRLPAQRAHPGSLCGRRRHRRPAARHAARSVEAPLWSGSARQLVRLPPARRRRRCRRLVVRPSEVGPRRRPRLRAVVACHRRRLVRRRGGGG